MDVLSIGRGLLLIGAANAVPWAVGAALGDRWAAPLDFGLGLWDGKRLLGPHKTWRGLISAVLACALIAGVVGLSAIQGAGIAAVALLGDALSSAVKRRLALPPGAEVVGLDQIPEVLLPAILFAEPLGLGVGEVVVVAVVFMILDVCFMPVRKKRAST